MPPVFYGRKPPRPGKRRSVSPAVPSISVQSTRGPGRASQDLAVSDPVWIQVRGKRVEGHVGRKERTHCVVVAESGKSYQAPWSRVFRRSDGSPKEVVSAAEGAKARFRIGDQVVFAAGKRSVRGTITRMNPKRATVDCDGLGRWRVPYPGLDHLSPGAGEETKEVLDLVAARARRLMSSHGLRGWSFQYDDSSRRAGSCRYDIKVITMAREYCLHAADRECNDTILHEIAHALVGPGHHHDAVWKRVARQLGCKADRCHSVNFGRPRYVIECPQCKWAATRMKRNRGMVCRSCGTRIAYRAFSEALWQRMRNQIAPGPAEA